MAVCLFLAFLLAASGCYTPLPTYPAMAPAAALATMAKRDASILSVRSPCDLTLTNAAGSSVAFEAVIIAEWPDRLRLRAWKFGQPAFDLTFTREGLWLYMPEEARKRAGDSMKFSVTADQFRRVWTLLDPRALLSPHLEPSARDDGKTVFFRRAIDTEHPDQGSLECDIDAETLTIREYRFKDNEGKLRQTLRLRTYRVLNSDSGSVVWPTEIEADGDSGKIVIRMGSTEFNPDLGPEVFQPPKRAVKQP